MTHPQIIGNNDIEALAERLCFGKTEDPFRAPVPEANYALGIGKDDRVGRFADECKAETVDDVDGEAQYFISCPTIEAAPKPVIRKRGFIRPVPFLREASVARERGYGNPAARQASARVPPAWRGRRCRRSACRS